MLEDLVKIALVGTARNGAALPPAAGPVGDALAALPPAAGPEAALLRAAAVGSAFAACGRVPSESAAPPAPAPPDARPACSARAADVLARLLAMSDTPTKAYLLGEWLDRAAAAGRRAPPRPCRTCWATPRPTGRPASGWPPSSTSGAGG